MSSPFQQKFMAKNPTKGFTMDRLERLTTRAEKRMRENAAILPQIEGPGNPDFESQDPQGFAGDDTHTYKKEDDSPLGMYAYVSTAPHFQRLQDNIAAAFTPKKKTGQTSEDKKNQAEEAYWKSKTTTSEENNIFKDEAKKFSKNLEEITGKEFKGFKDGEYQIPSISGFEKNQAGENYFNKFG